MEDSGLRSDDLTLGFFLAILLSTAIVTALVWLALSLLESARRRQKHL